MWVIASFIVLFSSLNFTILPDYLAELSQQWHLSCLSLISKASAYQDHYRALVCGQALSNGANKDLLRASGLIHFFVVSGAHILSIEVFLRKLLYLPKHPKLKEALFLLVLTSYAAVTLFNAPVLRSLLQVYVSKTNRLLELNYTRFDCMVLSLCLSLFLRPELWLSFSLQLSCAASSLLICTQIPWRRACLIYAAMLFYLADLGAPAPISILFNLIFSPVFSFLLLPMSWLSTFVPQLLNFSDFIWLLLYKVLSYFHPKALLAFKLADNASLKNWLLLSLQLFFIKIFLASKQKARFR